jgi:hypothetical protein
VDEHLPGGKKSDVVQLFPDAAAQARAKEKGLVPGPGGRVSPNLISGLAEAPRSTRRRKSRLPKAR